MNNDFMLLNSHNSHNSSISYDFGIDSASDGDDAADHCLDNQENLYYLAKGTTYHPSITLIVIDLTN